MNAVSPVPDVLFWLLAAGWAAGRSLQSRLGFAFFAFGLWDIFYYVWLRLMIGWPQSWLEWDVLFLIPWPWFGPWITPVLIALLFVLWGGWTLTRETQGRFTWISTALFTLGTILALSTFLLPGLPLLAGGTEAFRQFTPPEYSWAMFVIGYILMAVGLLRVWKISV